MLIFKPVDVMSRYWFLLVLSFSFITSACSQYSDGTYCGEVSRYNPRTYKESNYTLTIGIKNNKVVRIDWPNGGELDTDHFRAASIRSKVATFKDDKGDNYKVTVIKKGSECWEGGSSLVQCSGKTKKGDRCKNSTGKSNGRCWRH